eukprot:364549-Chlamydomonas_euryale.AAC.5
MEKTANALQLQVTTTLPGRGVHASRAAGVCCQPTVRQSGGVWHCCWCDGGSLRPLRLTFDLVPLLVWRCKAGGLQPRFAHCARW